MPPSGSAKTSKDEVATPLGGPQGIATVAAAHYLEGRPAPRVPADLMLHRCLNVRLDGGLYRWEYQNKGRRVDIQVSEAQIAP